MQTRHRIPTIFNLSMVDVLCCALGCIILLWLVYFKEARERSRAAGKTSQEFAATKLRLDDVLRDLTSAQQLLSTGRQKSEHLSGQLLEITAQRDEVLAKFETTDKEFQAALRNLKDAKGFIAALQKDVKDLEKLNAGVKAILAQKSKEYSDLAAKFLAATQSVKDLEKLVGDQKGVLASSAAIAAALNERLAEADKNAAQLQTKLTESDKNTTTLQTKLSASDKNAALLQAKLAASEKDAAHWEQRAAALQLLSKDQDQQLAKLEAKAASLQGELDRRKLDLGDASKRYDDLLALKHILEKNLADAKGNLATTEKALVQAKSANVGLEDQTKVLTQRIDQLRSAVDNRFAGIELTGSKVLFLVDMSGSMRMKDNNSEDPDKWPLVCDVLGKLMKSLPDIKHFQVILFSDKIRYPLANAGKWHDYHGPASVKNVVDAALAETPQNSTNMSVVFEEAFKFRATGLDTIYLLSDGLPNEGDGLPPGAEKLPDVDRSILLGKHIRDKLKTIWNAPKVGGGSPRVRINTVGFFFESPDVGAFLWALARDNDGSFVGLSKP